MGGQKIHEEIERSSPNMTKKLKRFYDSGVIERCTNIDLYFEMAELNDIIS